jgi:hypothetical protein
MKPKFWTSEPRQFTACVIYDRLWRFGMWMIHHGGWPIKLKIHKPWFCFAAWLVQWREDRIGFTAAREKAKREAYLESLR